MLDWKKEKLSKYIKIKHGFAFPGSGITQEETTDILVTPGNFNIGGGFKFDKFKYFNGTVPNDYIFQGGEIIVTMTDLSQETDTLGFSAKVPQSSKKKYLHNQRVGLVNFHNNELHPDYCYWVMRTRDYQESIVNSASGTSIMHTSPDRIADYDALIPPLPEQQAIAELLSSLDDKIDLLYRNNKTLEEMAETLFRQWFVDENTEMWSTVGEEFDVVMGQSPPGNTYNENEDGVPFYQGRTDFTIRFPSRRIFCNAPSRMAMPMDTLLSVRAPVGDTNIASEECCIGRGLAAIRHKDKAVHYSYTFLLFNFIKESFDVHEQSGTVFGSISKNELLALKCPKLSEPLMFNEKIAVIEDKVTHNSIQIEALSKLRNTLLPKLMSGQVRVNINA